MQESGLQGLYLASSFGRGDCVFLLFGRVSFCIAVWVSFALLRGGGGGGEGVFLCAVWAGDGSSPTCWPAGMLWAQQEK